MEKIIKTDFEEFICSISEKEKKRNRDLRRKISFLRQYIGEWNDEISELEMRRMDPNPFFITKEIYDV